jgi:hypothetical protein
MNPNRSISATTTLAPLIYLSQGTCSWGGTPAMPGIYSIYFSALSCYTLKRSLNYKKLLTSPEQTW